ncbi:hypothetical protein ASPZODRAFT_136844 [Penicilliopsis zonata CBS 506.65]|uniref:Glucosidase 2 subunit beta n=1 Tax=Penicilliopsis zonata CBS 506.65 TaxID=1073090 RepID=A0A1L9S735_9EURO|nr:hypothetical protein ASPZODRAFT_136844 [Penicilliopsis zonata CBS 506.65]OJJ42969.1 hypothetical protein ASPZODRAFT_136844 [Penicilliopsis zonata CBS 506.65]
MILPHSQLLLLSLAAGSTVLAASNDGAARPRGVGPEFAKFYKDTTTFSCISNPAIKIPFSAVNDDFCDCPDGSDEPGTSACSYISSQSALTVAERPGHDEIELKASLPGFYCKNKGHKPAYIPFQRVNDGVCDYSICCDGSDEWAHVGGTKCEDRCKEIGKAWRKQDEQRQKSLTAALRKKKELLVDAGRQQKEVEDHIERLEMELKGEELKVSQLEQDLEEIQKQESRKVVKSKKKGKVNVLAQLAKERVEELRNALIDVRKERDETRSRVKELEEILAKFKVEYNPNFNDEGVKRAVRSWEEYAAREDTENQDGNAAFDRDLDEISKADSGATGIDWDKWENEEGGHESDIIYQLAAYLPPSIVAFLEDKFISAKTFLEKNGILAEAEGEASSEPKAVAEARDRLKAAQGDLKKIQKTLDEHRSDLETDYGTASIFRALKDVCISKDSGEYEYEHCFLDKTRQKPKKGGSTALMGKFVRISTVSADELNEAGELVQVEKLALEYANGQSCWNGPARSTTVILECGEENEILKVMEDEKCVYSMLATSPAACVGGEAEGNVAPRQKDEL